MHTRATHLLQQMLGSDAQFHPGQLEAIGSILARKRTLIVQRTGRSKSVVYFIATKLLRESGAGPALRGRVQNSQSYVMPLGKPVTIPTPMQ